jgi:hypothetical protein
MIGISVDGQKDNIKSDSRKIGANGIHFVRSDVPHGFVFPEGLSKEIIPPISSVFIF